MNFKESKSMKIFVLPEQEKELSSKECIELACTELDVLAFDIFHNECLVGFIMVRHYNKNEFFLWNCAIDYRYQKQNFGTTAPIQFISYMCKEYNMKVLTTTYMIIRLNCQSINAKIKEIKYRI